MRLQADEWRGSHVTIPIDELLPSSSFIQLKLSRVMNPNRLWKNPSLDCAKDIAEYAYCMPIGADNGNISNGNISPCLKGWDCPRCGGSAWALRLKFDRDCKWFCRINFQKTSLYAT